MLELYIDYISASTKGNFEVDEIIDGPFVSAEDLHHGQDSGCPFFPVPLGIYERLRGEQGVPDCGHDGLDVSLRPWTGGKLPDVGRLRFQMHKESMLGVSRGLCMYRFVTRRSFGFRLFADVSRTQDDTAGKYVGLRLPNLRVASPATFTRARTWIEECFTEHRICARKNTTRLPTRVLDILVPDGGVDIRLHISDGARAQCCGSKLLLGWPANHSDNKIKFDTSHVLNRILRPSTPKDAVIVTLNLGIRYLWIDSLCIVQDDLIDKRVEISKMSSIYQNSYARLVAASTDSSHQGFLEDRPITNLEKSTPSPFRCPDGTLSRVSLFEFDRNDRFHDPRVVERLDRKDPIDRRGWTSQERVTPKNNYDNVHSLEAPPSDYALNASALDIIQNSG